MPTFYLWRRRLLLAAVAAVLMVPAAAQATPTPAPPAAVVPASAASGWTKGPAGCSWFSYLHWRVHACARKQWATDSLGQRTTRGAVAVAGYRTAGAKRYRRVMRFSTQIAYGGLHGSSGWTRGRVERLVDYTVGGTVIGGESYPVYGRVDVEFPNNHREVYFFRS